MTAITQIAGGTARAPLQHQKQDHKALNDEVVRLEPQLLQNGRGDNRTHGSDPGAVERRHQWSGRPVCEQGIGPGLVPIRRVDDL